MGTIHIHERFQTSDKARRASNLTKLLLICTIFWSSTYAEYRQSHKLNGSAVNGHYIKNMTSLKTRISNKNCSSSDEDVKCGTIEYIGCTGTKKFYHESAIKMTWFESWEYCRSIGLHLAAIESRYEQMFIELLLPPLGVPTTETYWTSGTDLGKEGQFTWMATGRPVSYENFRYGEPNNRFGSENCIELVVKPEVIGYQWNDRNCLIPKGYVLCQHDLRYPDKLIEADPDSS